MPGDLNVKKSWHPGLAKNKIKVAQAEKAAVEDLKAREARAAEIAKTRELEELRALQTGTPAKVGWIYDGQALEGNLDSEIKSVLKKPKSKKKMRKTGPLVAKAAKPAEPAAAGPSKSKADPMGKLLCK